MEPGGHLEVQAAQRLDAVVVLPQVGRFDDERVSHRDLLSCVRPASSASNSRRISSSVTPRARSRSTAAATMRLPGAKLVGQLLRPRVAGDERAGAVAQLDDAFVLELAVGLGHGVRVDHELLRQRADAGQLLARPQRAGFDGVLHLLHQLEVDGNAGRRDWAGTACMQLYY